MTRNRTVESKAELEKEKEEYIQNNYKVAMDDDDYIFVKKKTWGSMTGHFLVAILTIWWSFGIGNILYGLYKSMASDAVHVTVEE
jgi:hypothetical protein